MDRFAYRIFQLVQKNQLIKKGEKVIVSLSGGLDSISLFWVLQNIRESIEFDLHLCHFHHGLRQESDEDVEFIQSLAKKNTVSLTLYKAEDFLEGNNLQNRARQWRYEKLQNLLEEKGYQKIALGHHLNDLIETQMWKLMRGGSLFALAPMQLEMFPYIRPLLYTRKEELKNWCVQSGFKWREDSSNQQNGYTRNRIRNQLIPDMKKNGFDQMEEKMFSFFQDALSLREFFDESIPAKLYQCEELSFHQISKKPRIFAFEMIHRFLLYHKIEEIHRSNIEEIYRLVSENRGNWKINLKSGRIVFGLHKQVRLQ